MMYISFFSFSGNTAQNTIAPKKVLQASTEKSFGVVAYTRQSLLEALAAETCLDIRVVGACHFASDVSADLADEAVKSFKLVGKLIASPEVSAVLQQKGA